MIKKILKRIIRQPLPCIAVCIFAAVLSFSLCYLQRSLEEERRSFEQTCNSIPVSFKLTELDGSKFEGQTGIEPWAMNEFVREYGDFYQLAKEVLVRLDFKGVIKKEDEQATPSTPFSGITALDAADELTEAHGGSIRWYEGYDESILSTKEFVCLVPEDYEGGDELEVAFTGQDNTEIIFEDNDVEIIHNYVQHTFTLTIVGRYTDDENIRIYCPYKTMLSILDMVGLAKESQVSYIGGILKNGTDIEKLREAREKWFAEPNPTGAKTPWPAGGEYFEHYFYALDIEDTLLRTLETDMKNSIYLNKFASVLLFILSAGAGFLTGFLIIRSRKREIALKLTMGDSKTLTFLELSLEQLTCALAGIMIGGAFTLWHPVWQLVTFAIIYYIGLGIALMVFLSKNLLTSIKEDE